MSMRVADGGRQPAIGKSGHDPGLDRPFAHDPAFVRIDRMLRREETVWLSSVCTDGSPHLVPIWFSWDGRTILIASKPHAKKVANLRHNPSVMLALGAPEDDFDVGMLHGLAELAARPAAELLPAAHLDKYRDRMAAIGLTRAEFLATYSQVIRIRPTRVLPWHGRTTPASAGPTYQSVDPRHGAAIRRVAAGLAVRPEPIAGTSLAG